MTLFRNGAEITDEFAHIADDTPVPAVGAIVLGKARYLAEREALRGRNTPIGIALASGENLDGLEDDITKFALVELKIPRYGDGRLYSIARLLRDRHGFTGEIRASGDVLHDQIMALHRVGVDTFEITHTSTIAAMRAGAIVAPKNHLQIAAREDEEAHPGVRPWRRVSPAIPGIKP